MSYPERDLDLDVEVQWVSDEVSRRFIIPPSHEQVFSDTLVCLKQLRHDVRRRWAWVSRDPDELFDALELDPPNDVDVSHDSQAASDGPVDFDDDDPGLGTGLRPHWNTSFFADSPASRQAEGLLKEFEHWCMEELRSDRGSGCSYTPPLAQERRRGIRLGTRQGTTRPPKRARRIKRLLKALCDSSSVILRTDKTNQFYRADIADYNRWMLEHLASDAVEVPTEVLIAAHQDASTFVYDELGDDLSAREQKYLTQKLDSRRVATPKLLVKNHKPARADGSYKTRFVIPADGFMAGLGKMAYLGLKGILDGFNVVYASRQIDQSYTLKKRLESRGFKRGEVTCISLDVVKMYPSMQYSLLKAAVKHFTARLPRDVRATAAVCLKMLRFGMDRTFLQYGDKYYRYTEERAPTTILG